MALHSKWSSGDLTFYDGTQDVFKIKDNDEGIIIGEDSGGVDATFYGASASAYMRWDESEDDLVFAGGAGIALDAGDLLLGDTDFLNFGDDSDMTMSWDTDSFNIIPLADNADIEFGTSLLAVDVKFFGTTGVKFMQWDSANDRLKFDQTDIFMGDTDFINFGDDNDMTMSWDTDSFNIIPLADNADIEFGTSLLAVDVKFFGTTGVTFMQWDSANDKLTFDQADIALGDTDHLYLGDDPDVDVYFDGTDDLYIIPGTDLYNLKIGSSGGSYSWDVYLYGATAGNYLWFDAANDKLETVDIDIELENNDHLYLGSCGDVDMYFNGANDFYVLPATDVDNLYLGSTGGDYSWDVIWTGTTGSNVVTFGGASDDVTFANVDLVLGDNSELQLGDGSSGDWRLYFDAAQLMLEPVTAGDHADFYIGSTGGSLSIDMTWFGDAGTNYVEFDSTNNLLKLEDVDILLGDDDEIRFGSTGAGDIVIDFDGTELNVIPAADGTDILLGSTAGTASVDIKWFASTATDYVFFDNANNVVEFEDVDIVLKDNTELRIGSTGTVGDIVIKWDATELNIVPAVDGTDVFFGSTDGDYSLDIKTFGTTGTAFMLWDSANDELVFDKADISMGDTDYIKLGDSDDFTIACSAADVLQIIPAVEEADINFGSTAGDKSVDITIYGNDAAHHLKWVSASDELDVTATVEMQSTEKIQFSDTNHYINASTTGQLDIVTDGTLYLNGEVTYPTPAAQTSTGTAITLLVSSNRIQFLTSTGNFDVFVPTSSGTGVAGVEFKILNSTGGICTVYETSTGGALVATIAAGAGGSVVSNATDWRSLGSS